MVATWSKVEQEGPDLIDLRIRWIIITQGESSISKDVVDVIDQSWRSRKASLEGTGDYQTRIAAYFGDQPVGFWLEPRCGSVEQ
jgi:hypothetical protein